MHAEVSKKKVCLVKLSIFTVARQKIEIIRNSYRAQLSNAISKIAGEYKVCSLCLGHRYGWYVVVHTVHGMLLAVSQRVWGRGGVFENGEPVFTKQPPELGRFKQL